MERVPTETQRGISQLQLADGTAAGSESLTGELFEKILVDPHLEKHGSNICMVWKTFDRL